MEKIKQEYECDITKKELFGEIQKALSQTDFLTAQKLLEQCKKYWEYSDDLAILESEIFISTGHPDKALTCIEKGLAFNSSNHELYFMLGESYELLNNLVCAELCFRYAIYQCHEEKDLVFLKENLDRFYASFGSSLPKLSIILKVNQNPAWLKLCLQVITLFTMPDHYDIFFLKEQSAEPIEFLNEQTLGTVIPCDSINMNAYYNTAIEHTEQNSDLVIIDDGGLPLEHTLFTLQLSLHQSFEAGAVGAISNHVTSSRYLKKPCPTANDAMEYAHKYNVPTHSSLINTFSLPGPIYMFKRSFIKRYGWFDTDFCEGKFQIFDYLLRIVRENKNVFLCPNSLSILTPDCSPQENKVDAELFYNKHGINLSYSCYAREDLLSLFKFSQESCSIPFNILEIGCACGATLIEIKRLFPNASLYGIELDKESASIAAHFATVTNKNIENASLEYPQNFFDFIIFGDVLEHLREPDKVLETMHMYLKKEGRILASIPNVMNISVLKSLLSGYWTYQDAGILDKTHLKFFTYNEIQRLFQNAGYQIEEIAATTTGIAEEDNTLITKLAAIQHTPESWFQAYQYLIAAKKK